MRTAHAGALITALLVAAVAVAMLATELSVPSMPTLPGFFGSTVALVQLSIALNLVGYALAPPLLGPLSDRFGRRPVLLWGLAVFVFASALAAASWHIVVFIVARTLQGLAGAAAPVVGMAIVRDLYDEKGSVRVIAVISMSLALAPALGPVLGGYIHYWFGWQANFVLLAVAGAAVVVLLAWKLGETNGRRDGRSLLPAHLAGDYATLLRDRGYVGYALLAACGFAAMTAFVTGGPFYLQDTIGLRPQDYGWVQLALVCCYVVGALAANRGIGRFGFERLHLSGVALFLVGGAGQLAVATLREPSVVLFSLPFGVFLVGLGVVFSTAPARALAVLPALAGRASALLTSLDMAAGGLAAIAVGLLHDGGAVGTSVVIAVSALAGVAVQAFVVRARAPA